ncbi:NAD(P)H-dependent oxidoreductase [Bifidobacterium sp. W8106]|nr:MULTISPECIES: NAD(P)H-dependent oxidoreductase [Bifidobacterium]MBI0142888.1 NAD(P)H-dependent oxidoreductase [Bifidobacterium choladohabitans]MBI0147678.1 NAD(P)H-dependent oxidoreductase [Bifidobacterium sp. W8104]
MAVSHVLVQLPSAAKGLEDLVLTYGWIYGTHGDALKSKELMPPVSVVSARENYHHESEFGYTLDELLPPFKATSNLIGTTYRKPFTLTGVSSGMSNQSLKKAAKDYLNCLQGD